MNLPKPFVYLAFIVVMAVLLMFVLNSGETSEDVSLSEVIARAKAGEVETIEVSGDNLQIFLKGSDTPLESRKETSASMEELLREHGVSTTGPNSIDIVVKNDASPMWLSLLFNFLPIIIIVGIILFMMKSMRGQNNQAMSFGKSRAKSTIGTTQSTTFDDVAGQEEGKQELMEVVEFLKHPEKFAALGAQIPKGVLLVGPPGCGKTLIGKAVAGEAGVPFFFISGSEFVEMFVGVGASRVRDLFDKAKKSAPSIVFIDEIDAVGRQRGAGVGGSHDEREQTLNQMLVEMDGFESDTSVIIIAATNRPDVLDPALLRPGRIDRKVVIDLPDVKGRRAILDIHAKGKPRESDVDLEVVAKQTPGFSGADLMNLVNESAILAARGNQKRISMKNINESIDRVSMGPERKSRIITPEEKRIVAYHEAGHTIAGWFLPHADPPFKVTIISRGTAGGFTRSIPKDDRRLQNTAYYGDLMAMALGGMVAERMIFEDVTTGPSSDIGKVTQIARSMVTQWGMSERLGPRTFGGDSSTPFLGRSMAGERDYSDETAGEIDEEVRRLIEEAQKKCEEVLTEHKDKLDELAEILMDVETVEGEALKELLGPRTPSDS